MPKERKQRGRRKKAVDKVDEPLNKDNNGSGAIHDEGEQYPAGNDYVDIGDDLSSNFFGLLDESEQTYFKMIDDAFIADEFADASEKETFVTNVYKEAETKELKLATSPLGSRVLEQLLARSSPNQIRRLFTSFQGHFHALIMHRYASHVCEMMFAIISALVGEEQAGISTAPEQDDVEAEPYVSGENLFLYMYNEISGDLPNLVSNAYASHVVRDILLILAGDLFIFADAKGQKKRYHAQKKFSWSSPTHKLSTPASFKDHLRETIERLATLPSVQLRMLASQPISMPFIQALITLEARTKTSTTSSAIISLLGGGEMQEREDFIELCLREASGSKLIESIVDAFSISQYAQFYTVYIRGRAERLAKDPIANFVMQKIIIRCPDTLILDSLIDEIASCFADLFVLNHIQVIQKLVECCIKLHHRASDIFNSIRAIFNSSSDPAHSKLYSGILFSKNCTEESLSNDDPSVESMSTRVNIQGAHLLMQMLDLPDAQSSVISKSLLDFPSGSLVEMTKLYESNLVLQSWLRRSQTSLVDRKLLLNKYFGTFADLACHVTGSRFVDTCWPATSQMKLYKDRIAQELVQDADIIRANHYGRLVWKNWHMDLFKNRRGEWNSIVKAASAKEQALLTLSVSRAGADIEMDERQPSTALVSSESMHPSRQQLQAPYKRQHEKTGSADAANEIERLFSKKGKPTASVH